ncbi:fatty acid desaturase [Sphingomonas sp. RP10(2022)]|uniref:Fatty acid desaturase n=1 Tax=Sphingomonas liriopis TaxID=2949094 RepID=A0A9X2KRL4_9SPHN|nr:fatty acid desaturase [Sphingomonas liriopis]MCP3735731.1 fatty acid desaturase [Sphingomonas liriopis]
MAAPSQPPHARRGVEWPTVALAAAIYGGWLALTWWHAALPTIAIVAIGGWLIAWQGSLQHETIHGHPTGIGMLDDAIGYPPLALWLPYPLYRRSHIAHHASARITDPVEDPESRYLATDAAPWHWFAALQSTLVGRLVFGPPLAVLALLRDERVRWRRDSSAVVRDWLPHLLAIAPILAWLDWTGFGIGRYLLFVVYPGMALTLLRSFAEHRADLPGPARAATVRHGGVFALLFLNNNLHAAHHERPGVPWYRLPAYHRHHAARLEALAGRTYRSYGEIVRRFALRRHDAILHPAPHPAQDARE